MRSVLAVSLLVVTGCASMDLKGREVSRLGPLRGARVVAARVAPAPVPIDAGTNVLTDAELLAIAAELPGALQASFDRVRADAAATPIGEARVLGCQVNAGPGRAYTVYEARCRVSVFAGDVALIEVHAQALRRVRSRAISEDEAREIQKLERNPLLSTDDTRAVLVAALDAAAKLIAGDALPTSDKAGARRTLDAGKRRSLALERYARARAGDGNMRAALHDLSEAGLPEDAALVATAMDAQAAADVSIEEIRAVGILCSPRTLTSLQRLRTSDPPSPHTVDLDRAEARVAACAALPPLPSS